LCVDIQKQKLETVEACYAQPTAIEHVGVADYLLEDLGCSALIEEVLAFAGGAVFVLFS